MNKQNETILCTPGFRAFFQQLECHADSPQQVAALIEEHYHLIAAELPMARVDVQLDAPQNVLDPIPAGGRTFSAVCGSGEMDDTPETFTHTTGDKGRAVLSFYPPKGYTWNDREKEALGFLSQVIFLICGRARLGNMMSRICITDMLTGVSNTRGFMRFGEQIFQQGKLSQYTGIFLNIKNFNYINQAVGPKQGDRILRQYAQSIVAQLDPKTESFCRMGGDNFTMLVQKDHAQQVLDFLSTIHIEVEAAGQTRAFDICSRAGIYPIREQDTISDMMSAMTAAFHQTKVPNRGDYVWFEEGMLKRSLHGKEVSLMFPKALEAKEFVVYYQPKVTLSDNRLCGCEALVRWFRNGKIVPPMEFIPVLEQEGSICRLDFYMLEQVCQDIRAWQAKGIEPFCVSVNFSKAHLQHPDFADRILSILKRYQVESKYIEVELTETSTYENYETMHDFVNKMKANGVSTSIDDFGTGYSSLNLLKNLDVDIIKLDKSFLDNLDHNRKSDEIVIKHIVSLVSYLNMDIIAEGVETSGQADFLRSVHCDMAQGYLFDRPLPREEFEKRLQNRVYDLTAV